MFRGLGGERALGGSASDGCVLLSFGLGVRPIGPPGRLILAQFQSTRIILPPSVAILAQAVLAQGFGRHLDARVSQEERWLPMDDVWLLVVKGNLRDRIELLGCEKRYEDMTEAQRILRDAAKLQGLKAWGTDLDPEAKPERPRWAGGPSSTCGRSTQLA